MTIPAAPKISITNTDNRQIQNLRLAVSFVTDGAPHFDFEDQGTFDRVTTDGLDATRPGGTWNGNNWVGNFLYTKGSQSTHAVLAAINQELAKAGDSWSDAGDGPILPEITIIKEDPRDITALRVAADFTIDGQPYTDYEDIGPFDRHYLLELNGLNGSWNGTQWVGNFLSTKASGFETEIDPGWLAFLNFLVIFAVAGSAVAASKGAGFGGGGWKLRQLI